MQRWGDYAVKKTYLSKVTERAIDLIENDYEGDIYKVDLKVAMTMVYDIWSSISSSTIYNCFDKTGMM